MLYSGVTSVAYVFFQRPYSAAPDFVCDSAAFCKQTHLCQLWFFLLLFATKILFSTGKITAVFLFIIVSHTYSRTHYCHTLCVHKFRLSTERIDVSDQPTRSLGVLPFILITLVYSALNFLFCRQQLIFFGAHISRQFIHVFILIELLFSFQGSTIKSRGVIQLPGRFNLCE